MTKICHADKCFCTDFNRKFCKEYREPGKPKKQGLIKTRLSNKRKPTGELEFFKHLWNKRSRVCYITGDPLQFHVGVFFHVLPKGAYPDLRLDEGNIIFVKPILHAKWHSKGRTELLSEDPRWQKVFDLYEQLKKKYA